VDKLHLGITDDLERVSRTFDDLERVSRTLLVTWRRRR